jgi:acetyl-CoA C-acetyltransferase
VIDLILGLENRGLDPAAQLRVDHGAGIRLTAQHRGLSPVKASQQALRRADMTIGDVDPIEINEALAAQFTPSARD